MNLSVFVLGREVATLEPVGDFRSSLHYHAGVAPKDFVSLTMRVRTEPYLWDEPLHPIFQMNLPEGYLLQVLQEKFGPQIGANPVALLSIIGRNMIGRVQVAPPGADISELPKPVDVAALLQGDNSEEAFSELVREYATSGVSGVVPKFLDGPHTKATMLTDRHIVKGSTRLLPFVSMNEHLCMQVVRRVMDAAETEVSEDGQLLLVHRFDLDEHGNQHWGMEDFCVLLGLRPANKYDSTWERIAKAIRDHVPPDRRAGVFQKLATILLLSYTLRNADCHAKNIALRYTDASDVDLAPVYDMITTAAYPDYAKNPPGISFMGRKTWMPGNTLHTFITANFGVKKQEQQTIVERISEAVAEVGPFVREAMDRYPGFSEVGKRMLTSWQEGVDGLRSKRVYSLGEVDLGKAFTGFSAPTPANPTRTVIGRSELLGSKK